MDRLKENVWDVNDPVALAEMRIQYKPGGSGPNNVLGVLIQLIDAVAEDKGFNLTDYHDEAKANVEARWAQQEADRRAEAKRREEEAAAKSRRNYIKKHGHEPFEVNDKVLVSDGTEAKVIATLTGGRYTVEQSGGWTRFVYGANLTRID